MPANQANKHAVYLSGSDIKYVRNVLKMADSAKASEISDALRDCQQADYAYVVTSYTVAVASVHLDEDAAKEEAERLEEASSIGEKYRVERVAIS